MSNETVYYVDAISPRRNIVLFSLYNLSRSSLQISINVDSSSKDL